MRERIKFYGIDSWNRPVFKSLDKPKHYYGDTSHLFDYDAKEAEVLERVRVEDIRYFGSRFDCEPYGTYVEGLEIVKGEERE